MKYEVIIEGGAGTVQLTSAELLRLTTQRGRYDGAFLTTGMVWFWRAWRRFQYVRGTVKRAA